MATYSNIQNNVDTNYLLPINVDRQRSHSMNDVIQVHTKLLSAYHKTADFHSQPLTLNNNVKLNLCQNYPTHTRNICSSTYPSSSMLSNYSNQHNRIEEPESLDFNKTRSLKRAYDPLFMCFINNIYPEKRQSEPHICYSFYNRSFDAMLPSNRRFLSQHDVRKNAMPNIAEYGFEEPVNWKKLKPKYEDDDDDTTASIPSTPSIVSPVSLPKIKVRISDEWGYRIENSFDSINSDFYNDNFNQIEFLSDEELVTENSIKRDAFDVISNNDGNLICCSKIEHCTKCGHHNSGIIQKQFSTSFN